MSKFWIAGKHTVISALLNKKNKIHKILLQDLQNAEEIPKNFHKIIKEIKKKEISKILDRYQDISHQGFFAEIEREYSDDKQKLFEEENLIVLDGLNDQRNIGAIIRTASAFNINQIIINKKDVIINNLLLNKTASGGMDIINLFQASNVINLFKDLKKQGFWFYGFDGKSKIIFDKKILNKKNVFIFGSESKGMREIIKKNCDYSVKININDKIDSLNVAASVASALTTLRSV